MHKANRPDDQHAEPVQHVFVDHDTDLLDVTLRTTTADTSTTRANTAANGGPAESQATRLRAAEQADHDETIHTTAKHPWLTVDHDWVKAGELRIGESVRRVDGTTAVVVAVRVVPGAADMWDLTLGQVHTFAVGTGAYVVHNCGGLPTTVSGAPDGSVSVTSGAASSGPYFTSILSGDKSTFTIGDAFRGGLQAHASDVLAEQFAKAGGDASLLQQLVLHNVVEENTIRLGHAAGSPLDKMAQYFAQSIGVRLGPPQWVGPLLGGDITYGIIP